MTFFFSLHRLSKAFEMGGKTYLARIVFRRLGNDPVRIVRGEEGSKDDEGGESLILLSG